MNKIEVIEDRVYLDIESFLDAMFEMMDRVSRVLEHMPDPALANQLTGMLLICNKLEEIVKDNKPSANP